MPFFKYLKPRIALLILIAIAFIVIILLFQRKEDRLSQQLEIQYKSAIEQAEMFQGIQLDSARIYAYRAYKIACQQQNDFNKYSAQLLLSEIRFLQIGASEKSYQKVELYEKWFRDHNHPTSAFEANLLRLKIKSFLKDSNNVRDDVDDLIHAANLSKSDQAKAHAYYFKMEQRDYTRTWEDDVHILDSARMFASRAKDSILLGKIRLMSVLPINGKPQAMDSVHLSLKQAIDWNNPELTCLSYEAVGVGLAPARKLDSALFYLRKGIHESERYGSAVLKMKNHLSMIVAYAYSFESDQVIKFSHEGLRLARTTNNKHSERRVLDDISAAWLKKSELSKSIVPLMQAIKIAKETNSEQGVFTLQRRLLNLLTKMKRFGEADELYTELLSFVSKKERNQANDLDRASIFYEKGRLERAKQNYDKALFFYQKSTGYFDRYKAYGAKRFYVDCSILLTLLELKQYERAKEKHAFMLRIYADLCEMDQSFLHIQGLMFYHLKQYDQAINSLKLSLEKGDGKIPEVQYESNSILSKIYEKIGNFKQALHYSSTAIKLKNEIDKKDEQNKLEQLQSKYELAQKETEIKKLDLEGLKKQNSLKSRRNSIIFLSILIVLLAAIAISISRNAKNKLIRKDLEKIALEKEREIERIKTEESKRAIDLKNQLFANISHEFRTPLALINAPLEELWGKVDESNKLQLNIIQGNADHLLVMVDEILELSKLDEGNAVLSKKSFALSLFIQKIHRNFEPIFKQKNVQLIIDHDQIDYSLFADEHRLNMVLNNLLKNALHHTSEGGQVKLTIHIDQTNNVLELTVFNSGNHINETFLPSIFDRYARSKEVEYSGYGIGLSFCQQIIALHGGEIKAENVENGVLLSFWIPTTFDKMDAVTAEIEPHYVSDVPKISGERLHKLLIVEDNLDMRNLLSELLFDQYEIILASNGEEGIERAEEKQPDLIISDIMMPKIGGMELTKTLKENFATSHIPIILLTAKSTGHDRITGLETGADDYLTKPFSPKELRVRVRNLIEQREKLRKRFSKNVFLIPEEMTSNSLDQAFLLKATEIVESNLDNPDFSVEQFCRKLALNRNSVHQKLKSLTESSASQFIKSIKLKKAATLLADERISIVEVSELAGFNNRQAFNKAFKDQFEMAPSEYRSECLKKNK